mgnify:CR=1 FL=1
MPAILAQGYTMSKPGGSPGRISFCSRPLSNAPVQTISGIRHANLLRLIEACGGVSHFAERIDRAYSQVSQLKNRSKHSRSGMPREIGDDMARHIEASWPLPTGWMDQVGLAIPAAAPLAIAPPHPHAASTEAVYANVHWPFQSINPQQWYRLPREDRLRVEQFVAALLLAADAHHPRASGA